MSSGDEQQRIDMAYELMGGFGRFQKFSYVLNTFA